MTQLKHTPLLLTIIIGLISCSTVNAQSFSIKPNLARMDNDKIGFGTYIEAGFERENTLISESGYPRFIEVDLGASISLLSKPSLNPNHQHLDVYLGYLISFKKAQDLTPGIIPGESPDYGALGFGFNANFEANQTFTEQNFEQGAELRYTNSSKPFLPVLELSYLFAVPYQSEIRDELNQGREVFQRFNARAFWAIRLGQFLFNPDFRYFKSVDLAPVLEENGLDEGFHTAIELGYVFRHRENSPLQFFEYLYLQYNRGQFPVYLENRETIEGGISFRF